MDKHYLTQLFQPESVVVFAGSADADADTAKLTPHAQALHAALRAQRYSGSLAELAQAQADLAIIALPPHDLPRRPGDLQRHRCGAGRRVQTHYPA